MKLKSNKQVRSLRANDWIVALAISFGIIFGSSLALGPILFGNEAASRKIVVAYRCPDAVDSTETRGPIGPVTSDPNGQRGQTVQITCAFADGSTRVISNDEVAVTSIGGMFIGGALTGVGLAIIFVPVFLFWRKKAG